ncbi:MAG: hypothetical protein MMC33_008126 [Icmadophila ericetorum]|nr:hypothetical protein [Icmadophila ericetorum]
MSQYEVKSYFVPGFGISRHIIFSHIQIYLGPDASVRPYSYRGREGYLVTAPGQPLTRSQIEDLQNLSRQYELQAAERMSATYGYNNNSSGNGYGYDNSGEEMYINMPVMVQNRRR